MPSDLTPGPRPRSRRRAWGAFVLFVLILIVGLTAGMLDRSAAQRWGRRLAGPDRDQRFEALARLARLDHLARVALRPLINALDDDRLPEGAVAVRRMLLATVPPAVSGLHLDLSGDTIAGRAAVILRGLVPVDYAAFYAEVKGRRAGVRRRAAGVLAVVGTLQSAKGRPVIAILQQMLSDPDRGVRRQAFRAVAKILDHAISFGTSRFVGDVCRLAIGEALIGADPDLAVEATRFMKGTGQPDNVIYLALFRAWKTIDSQGIIRRYRSRMRRATTPQSRSRTRR